MAEPGSSAVTVGTVVSLAGFLSAAPLGIPMTQLAWGGFFAATGVICRGVYEGQSALSKQNLLGLQYVLAWVLLGLFGAPFSACIVLYVLKLSVVQNDTWTAIALWAMGFSGPKGVLFIFSVVANFANTKFNLKGTNVIPGDLNGPKPGG